MGKFLFKVSYSPDGAKGVIESGGSTSSTSLWASTMPTS